MTAWKLKLVEKSSVREQYEFETTAFSHYVELIQAWTEVGKIAKAKLAEYKKLHAEMTAEQRDKHRRMAAIRSSLEDVMPKLALEKLMRQLEKHNYTHKSWGPFTTSKERSHAEDRAPKRDPKRERSVETDRSAGS